MKNVLKFFMIGGLVFAAIFAVGVLVVMQKSQAAIDEKVSLEFRTVEFSSDATAVARGKHLFASRGCADCHDADGGGKLVFEAPPMGSFSGSNLTQLGEYSDADWIRAIRFGLAQDGRKLVFMPAHEFTHYGDKDLNDLVAYIRTMPAVERANGGVYVGPLARLLYLKGDFPLLPYEMVDPTLADAPTPETGPTVAYGDYLLRGCIGCHGDGLSGGAIPGVPPDWPAAANLTMDDSGLKGWTREDFETLVQTATRPDGRKISEVMPLSVLKAMHEWERTAIWNALAEKPVKAFGNR
jgi:mono/diheme cytochrome c family protein